MLSVANDWTRLKSVSRCRSPEVDDEVDATERVGPFNSKSCSSTNLSNVRGALAVALPFSALSFSLSLSLRLSFRLSLPVCLSVCPSQKRG